MKTSANEALDCEFRNLQPIIERGRLEAEARLDDIRKLVFEQGEPTQSDPRQAGFGSLGST
jgi:hypothetical protein